MKKEHAEPVKSLLAVSMGLLVVYLVTKIPGLILAALGIGLIGLVSPFLTKQVHFIWMKLAYLLNLVIPKVILGIVFYLILTPIAILARLFRKKDPLLLVNNQASTYHVIHKEFTKSSFEHPW